METSGTEVFILLPWHHSVLRAGLKPKYLMDINDQMLCGWTSCANSASCLPSHHCCPFSSLSLQQLCLQSMCSKCLLIAVTVTTSILTTCKSEGQKGRKGEIKEKDFTFIIIVIIAICFCSKNGRDCSSFANI